MVLKRLIKNKKYIFFAIFIIATFVTLSKNYDDTLPSFYSQKVPSKNATTASNKQELSKKYKSDDQCIYHLQQYGNLEYFKKNHRSDLIFENTHFKTNDRIYRTRHFFKETKEGVIETFITYVEDEEENARIIELKKEYPGVLFQKFQHKKKSIIYHELAYEIPVQQLFIHFINNKLAGIQGNSLDCIYK